MQPERHGFPTSRGPIAWRAIATLADECLASVAYTLAEEAETTTTSSLHVGATGLQRPVPGRARHRPPRTRRLAYCHVTVEQDGGEVVAEDGR
jgi:acyl-coenzyme A thioesterase PaaI-like protein